MANGDDKGGDVNRGPADCPMDLVSDGPHEPYRLSDKPVLIGIAQALEWISDVKTKMANLEMELIELKRKLEESHD